MATDDKLAMIMKGIEEALPEGELAQKLSSGRKLRVKLGFDPTSPDVHLGHTVVMNKLRQFQDLGHEICFIIGDFTAMIGDPSGKSVTRPSLSRAEVEANAETYANQAFKILDKEKTQVRYNSEWLGDLSAVDLIQLAATHTVARMLERDDFHKRFHANQSIALHEFLYPLIQGYDSVAIDADIELGGTDQKFNLLMGRELQRHYGKAPQTVVTLPLLEGLDGVKKMSKSLDNYIGIDEPATEMWGKVMSISDAMMWRYYDLLSFCSPAEIAEQRQAVEEGKNPRDVKMLLAAELVSRFHGQPAAVAAEADFIQRFRHHALPDDIEERVVQSDAESQLPLPNLLKAAGLVSSTSEAHRMVKQGAVRIDSERVNDAALKIKAGSEAIYQVGKRQIAKVKLV
ncbi:MAG: tyrosine--tRNA ligase [Gammaproteobacteria bacterium]|nr:tyrosine--tRNA ligase [Gammaproteobacteria bacterium]